MAHALFLDAAKNFSDAVYIRKPARSASGMTRMIRLHAAAVNATQAYPAKPPEADIGKSDGPWSKIWSPA
jgi:hypothetical protein